jgi:hypothetical protein
MEGSVMRKLLSLILVLGLANPIAPVWARDGDKSLAGKATDGQSKKEREAELDALYDQMTESFNTWSAAREAYWESNGQTPSDGDPIGDQETYFDMVEKTSTYSLEVQEAQDSKQVRGSYEFKDPVIDW